MWKKEVKKKKMMRRKGKMCVCVWGGVIYKKSWSEIKEKGGSQREEV